MARIKDLEELPANKINMEDEFVIHHVHDDQEKRFKLSSFISRLFGGKLIGGATPNDITVNGMTQELTKKTLINPKINSSVETNVRSEDLNKLRNVQASAAQINNLIGVHSNIQQQLNNKVDAKTFMENMSASGNAFAAITVIMELEPNPTTGKLHVSGDNIKAALGLGPDVRIKHAMVVQIITGYDKQNEMPGHNDGGQGVETYFAGGRFDYFALDNYISEEQILVMIACMLEKA